MIDWVKLALLGLEIIKTILSRAEAAQQYDAGRQAEVARSAMELLRRTELGKQYAERVEALGDDDLTDLEKQLTGDSSSPGGPAS